MSKWLDSLHLPAGFTAVISQSQDIGGKFTTRVIGG
jgi:hypothetical protein